MQMAVSNNENYPDVDNSRPVPEINTDPMKATEANIGIHEDIRYQMPPLEEKQQNKNGGFIRLIIVAILAMAIGAGGAILVYREFETDQRPNCEVSVNGEQNQLGSSAQELITSTMSAEMVESFYEDLEKQREEEKEQNGVNIEQTGLLPPKIEYKLVDYTQLACGFDSYICMWHEAARWIKKPGNPNATLQKGGYLSYSSLNTLYKEAILTSAFVNNTEDSYCFLVQFQVLGKAALELHIDHDDKLGHLWSSSVTDGLWHLERVDIRYFKENFQLFLVASDSEKENVTVGIDYTDLRSGSCDSSMVVEDVPVDLRDISPPGFLLPQPAVGGFGGSLLQPVGENLEETPTPQSEVENPVQPMTGWGDFGLPPSHLTKEEISEPTVEDGPTSL